MKHKFILTFFITAAVLLALHINTYAAFTITAAPSNSHPDTQINLTWESHPSALMYEIFRAEGGSSPVSIKTVNVNTDINYLSYVDNGTAGAGLTPETSYNYTIHAYSDEAMQNEVSSSTTSVSTSVMLKPSIVSAVFDINNRTVTLNWINNSPAATGSTVKDAGAAVLATVDSGTTTCTFSDPAMVNNSPSHYTVVSSGGATYGPVDSNPVAITPIAAPVLTSSVENGVVTLSWDTNLIESFSLERSKYSQTGWGAWQAINTQLAQGTQSITDTLSAGGLYRYRLAAKSGTNYSGFSNISQTISKPMPPTNLSCTFAASNRIDLSWSNDLTNESGLIVEKKIGTGSYSTIAQLDKSAVSYSDTFAIIAGTDYYYRVSASDSASNTALGSEYRISATVPASPASLTMTVASTTRIDLNWTDNSNNEAGFKVERKIDSGAFEELSILPANINSFSDEGVSTGHTYTYRVRSYNQFGNSSGYTNEVSSTSSAVKTPASLEISVITSTSVQLTWSYSESTSLRTVVERKTGTDGTWTVIADLSSGATTYYDYSLTQNTRYFYRIKAKAANNIYSVPYPNDNTGKEAYTVFSPLYITVVSSSQINLSWEDKAAGETGFKVQRKTDSGSFTDIASLDANITTYSDKNVTAGHTYTYRVLLINSPASSTVYTNAVSASTNNITTPISLELDVVSPSQIDLIWDFSYSGSFSTIIERKATESGSWVEIARVESGKRSYSNTGLSDNTQYFYRIKAAFSSNIFSQTYPYDNTGVGAVTKIKSPTNLKGEALSDSQIYLTWTSNSSGVQYVIERKTELSDFYVVGTTAVNADSWSDVSLIPNYQYTYRIKAIGQNNLSEYSPEITVACSNLTAPSGLTANGLTSTSIELRWLDNTTNESAFEIWRTAGTTSQWELITSTGSNITQYIDSGLSANIQYSYKVRAYISSKSIYSAYSDTVSVITTVPNAPTVTYSRISDTSLNLTWTDNSTNESGFKVEKKEGLAGSWYEIASLSQNVTSYSVTSLNTGTVYFFRIKAYNTLYNSYSYSNELEVSLALPGAPSNITMRALSSSQIEINWTDNSNNELGFIIERQQSSGIFMEAGRVGQNTVRFVDSGLSSNQVYVYRIRAYNNSGSSAYTVSKAVATRPATVYKDIQNVGWAKSAIETLTSRGIIKGKTAETFAPNDNITRAEFVCLIIRAFNLNKTAVGSFTDVSARDWFYGEVMTAKDLGIVSGNKFNYFFPNRSITREDVAEIIVRTLKVIDKPFKGSSTDVLKKFSDRNSISQYAVVSVANLVNEGILNGRAENILSPKGYATRAEAALLLSKIIDR